MKDKKQKIGCDIHSCKYCNCDNNLCELRKIEIKKQAGCECATTKDETICASFKLREDIK